MADVDITATRPTQHPAEGQRKRVRKTQPEYPWRVTFALADDQYQALQVVKKMFRTSEALDLNENIVAIEQWRSTLDDKQRRRLHDPTSSRNGAYRLHQRTRPAAPALPYALQPRRGAGSSPL